MTLDTLVTKLKNYESIFGADLQITKIRVNPVFTIVMQNAKYTINITIPDIRGKTEKNRRNGVLIKYFAK